VLHRIRLSCLDSHAPTLTCDAVWWRVSQRTVLEQVVRQMWQPSTQEGGEGEHCQESDREERPRRSTAPVGAIKLPSHAHPSLSAHGKRDDRRQRAFQSTVVGGRTREISLARRNGDGAEGGAAQTSAAGADEQGDVSGASQQGGVSPEAGAGPEHLFAFDAFPPKVLSLRFCAKCVHKAAKIQVDDCQLTIATQADSTEEETDEAQAEGGEHVLLLLS
jgi:hypothetical protein